MTASQKTPRSLARQWSVGCSLALLAVCALMRAPANAAEMPLSAAPTVLEVLNSLRPDLKKVARSDSLERATSALQLAADLKLPQASRAINEALQLDPRNPWLHFFNGLIYHLQARQGDTEKTNTAIEGYRQAIRFDPNNWLAHEFLGLAYIEQRKYANAQATFAEVLLSRPNDLDTLQRMMASSYLAGDAATACNMADRIGTLQPVQPPKLLRSAVTVYAACGDFQKSQAMRERYGAGGPSAEDLERLDLRVESWRVLHKSRSAGDRGKLSQNNSETPATEPRMVKTQFGGAGSGAGGGFGGGGFGGGGFGGGGGGFGGAAEAVPRAAASTGDTRMVLVDVVMVRTEDTLQTTKGVNLLNTLSLQFGSASAGAFSRTFNSTSGADSTTVITRAITLPALTYSMNIANAFSKLNEVLARPTLAALEGARSEFFSGTSLNAAVVSGGAGATGSSVSIEKRYGVKLTVLPQVLANGMVKLSIDASRTFLQPPSNNIGFTYKLEISEITANANVVMRLGDTLILGGLSEKETTNTRDGVPVLQDVPLMQYFFSAQQKTDYQKSVLILITPRPANYTWLSDQSKEEFAKTPDDPFTPSMDVLRARYQDWFKPYPNLASVFHHLNAADLYRDFRTGDVTLEAWDRMDSTRLRLKQALGFLYY